MAISEDEKIGVRIRATLIANGLWASDYQGEKAVAALVVLVKQERGKTNG